MTQQASSPSTHTAWSSETAGYTVRCRIQNNSADMHTILVEENGTELERHIIMTTSESRRSPFDLAVHLYSKHCVRIVASLRTAQREAY